MGAQCDQDYLARLYFFDCYGGRRFIQVCVRSLRCRQRFRHRSFRGRPDRRHQAISGDAHESGPVARRRLRFSCTRFSCTRDTELAKANDVAVELLARISPAIVTPDIVSRHWQEIRPSRSSADENSKGEAQTGEKRTHDQQTSVGTGSAGLPTGRVRRISLGIQPPNRLPPLAVIGSTAARGTVRDTSRARRRDSRTAGLSRTAAPGQPRRTRCRA